MFFSCAHREAPKTSETKTSIMNNSIHQFKIPSLSGGTIDFSSFKGKKILVVNTASECGFTPQYAGLQELSEKYAQKLVVVGLPSNDIGGQDPGSREEIQSFCQKNFGVTFP
jgi:glutathione peroxidase